MVVVGLLVMNLNGLLAEIMFISYEPGKKKESTYGSFRSVTKEDSMIKRPLEFLGLRESCHLTQTSSPSCLSQS